MTTTHRAPRTCTALLALTLTALLAAGCGGKDSPAGPSASGSSADSSPGATSAASAAPATGGLMDSDYVSLRAPAGWKVEEQMKNATVIALGSGTASAVNLQLVPDFGQDASLTEQADLMRKSGSWTPPPTIEDETELAGLPAWHIHGKVDGGLSVLDGFGFLVRDRIVSVLFTQELASTTPGKRQQVIDSVLATVELK